MKKNFKSLLMNNLTAALFLFYIVLVSCNKESYIQGEPANVTTIGTTGITGTTGTNGNLCAPAPTASSPTGITCNSFVAQWTASTNATTYYLDVATNIGFTNFVSGYSNHIVGNVIQYNVSGLSPNTTYYLRVRAGSTCTPSANSNIISAHTSTSLIPSVPTASAATNVTSNSFDAQWSPSLNAANYYLDIATNTGFTTFVAGYNNFDMGNVTFRNVAGLNANTPYYYRVRAGSTCGSNVSANSNIITVPTTCNISATGGTIISSGGRTIHTFTSSGTFTITCGGGNVQVLVVAGGGGGGNAGGGGSGGLIYNGSYAVVSGNIVTVTVGNGGTAGGSGHGGNGGNSVFGTITTIGGGGGGGSNQVGTAGGSGGGGGVNISVGGVFAGGAGTAGQGYAGGTTPGLMDSPSGGGGGAGAAGGVKTAGNGLAYTISGSYTYYAGGGGGGSYGNGGAAGGLGGGGAGSTSNGIAGTANTGGGGGGAYGGSGGASGGSGIVIISYIP